MLINSFPGYDIKPDWNDPKCISINSLASSSHLIPFPTFRKCFDAVSDYRRYLSDFVYLLNDDWNFKKFQHVYELSDKLRWQDVDFKKTTIPFYADSTDRNQLLTSRISHASDQQAVYLFTRSCSLPHFWSSLRKKLTFASVSNPFHLFINGKPVGYSDIRNQSVSFDITSFWHDGENKIEMMIYEESSGSYLRSGWPSHCLAIPGDIYIEAFPTISVSDVQIQTNTNDTKFKQWVLSFEALIASCRISLDSPVIRTELFDDYKMIAHNESAVELKPISDDSDVQAAVKTKASLSCQFELDDIMAWSADKPYIYDLYITVSDSRGYEQVCYHLPIGFKSLERRGNGFKTNGKPLILISDYLTCSEFSNENISSDKNNTNMTSAKRISKKLIAVKKAGYNCLLLADGISDPAVFELADMLGLYLIVSTDIKPCLTNISDAIKQDSQDNRWSDLIIRVTSDLIHAGRSHCSVIAWNIGHNLTNWLQLDRLLKLVTEADPGRLNLIPGDNSASKQHPSVYYSGSGLKAILADDSPQIEQYSQHKLPIIYIPTSAAISSTEIHSRLNDMLTGQNTIFGLITGSGNDTEAASCLSMFVSTKFLSLEVDPLNNNVILTNLRPFAGFSNISLNCQSHYYQTWLSAGSFEVNKLGAGEMITVSIDDLIKANELPTHLNIEISWTDESWPHQGLRNRACITRQWSESDSILLEPPAGRYTPLSHGRVRVEQDKHLLLISGNKFWFIFNRLTGNFESWRCGETELLLAADTSIGAGPYWQLSGTTQAISSKSYRAYIDDVTYDCDGTGAVIEIRNIISFSIQLNMIAITRYEINQKGELKIATSVEYPSSMNDLEEISCASLDLVFDLSRHFNHLQWYGYGPTSNVHNHDSISDTLPQSAQENNWLKMHNEQASIVSQAWYGVHWLYTGNEQGLGLLISSDNCFSFSAVINKGSSQNIDSNKFFPRQYMQLKLDFFNLSEIFNSNEHNSPSLFDETDSQLPAKQKGRNVHVFKRQYTLQPSALNFI